MKLELRPLLHADLPAVLRIQRAAHGSAYQESAEVLARKLALAPEGCWIGERDGLAVAYVFAHPWRAREAPDLHSTIDRLPVEADCAFLHDLAVLPLAQGGGAGAALFTRVVRWAECAGLRGLGLVALADALGYWRRQGFSVMPAARMPPAYGEGAVLMFRGCGQASAAG